MFSAEAHLIKLSTTKHASYANYIMFHHQEIIRRILLLTLDDPHRKICTAIGMAVASIAAYDWPELWPDLLPVLLNLVNNQTNLNAGKYFCLTWSL